MSEPWDGGMDPQPDRELRDLQWSGDPQQPTRKQVRSLRFLHGVVPALSRVFGWTLVSRVDVHDDEGEHTPFYSKAYRWAMGALWGFCIELRDYAGKGVLWGAEILLMSSGRDPNNMRRGVGVVLGTIEGKERAHFNVGVDIIPRDFDPNAATLGTAFKCSVPCENFIDAPPDTWFKLSGDVGFIFRGGPGIIEFWVLGQGAPVLALDMAHKTMLLNGKKVLTE